MKYGHFLIKPVLKFLNVKNPQKYFWSRIEGNEMSLLQFPNYSTFLKMYRAPIAF